MDVRVCDFSLWGTVIVTVNHTEEPRTKKCVAPCNTMTALNPPRCFRKSGRANLPVGVSGPSEDKAAGDELRDDGGTKALRSCEQSGLAGSFSILAHYFPTSSASFRALNPRTSSRCRNIGSRRKNTKPTASTRKLFKEGGKKKKKKRARAPASHSESPEGP